MPRSIHYVGEGQRRAAHPRVRLAGLDADARYRDIGSGQRHWGSALMAGGLALPQESASGFGSALVRLVRDERQAL